MTERVICCLQSAMSLKKTVGLTLLPLVQIPLKFQSVLVLVCRQMHQPNFSRINKVVLVKV